MVKYVWQDISYSIRVEINNVKLIYNKVKLAYDNAKLPRDLDYWICMIDLGCLVRLNIWIVEYVR